MMQKKLVAAIVAGSLSVMAGEAGAAPSLCDGIAGNLVQNCGFEALDALGGPPSLWTSGTNNRVQDTSFADPVGVVHSGNQGLAFGSVFATSALSQTLATNAGTLYDIHFWLNMNDLSNSTVTLSWNGTQIFNQSDLPATGWTEFSLAETASSDATLLSFGLRQAPSWSGLDDVVVTAATLVPEPGSLLLLGTSLLGLGLLRRRG